MSGSPLAAARSSLIKTDSGSTASRSEFDTSLRAPAFDTEQQQSAGQEDKRSAPRPSKTSGRQDAAASGSPPASASALPSKPPVLVQQGDAIYRVGLPVEIPVEDIALADGTHVSGMLKSTGAKYRVTLYSPQKPEGETLDKDIYIYELGGRLFSVSVFPDENDKNKPRSDIAYEGLEIIEGEAGDKPLTAIALGADWKRGVEMLEKRSTAKEAYAWLADKTGRAWNAVYDEGDYLLSAASLNMVRAVNRLWQAPHFNVPGGFDPNTGLPLDPETCRRVLKMSYAERRAEMKKLRADYEARVAAYLAPSEEAWLKHYDDGQGFRERYAADSLENKGAQVLGTAALMAATRGAGATAGRILGSVSTAAETSAAEPGGLTLAPTGPGAPISAPAFPAVAAPAVPVSTTLALPLITSLARQNPAAPMRSDNKGEGGGQRPPTYADKPTGGTGNPQEQPGQLQRQQPGSGAKPAGKGSSAQRLRSRLSPPDPTQAAKTEEALRTLAGSARDALPQAIAFTLAAGAGVVAEKISSNENEDEKKDTAIPGQTSKPQGKLVLVPETETPTVDRKTFLESLSGWNYLSLSEETRFTLMSRTHSAIREAEALIKPLAHSPERSQLVALQYILEDFYKALKKRDYEEAKDLLLAIDYLRINAPEVGRHPQDLYNIAKSLAMAHGDEDVEAMTYQIILEKTPGSAALSYLKNTKNSLKAISGEGIAYPMAVKRLKKLIVCIDHLLKIKALDEASKKLELIKARGFIHEAISSLNQPDQVKNLLLKAWNSLQRAFPDEGTLKFPK